MTSKCLNSHDRKHVTGSGCRVARTVTLQQRRQPLPCPLTPAPHDPHSQHHGALGTGTLPVDSHMGPWGDVHIDICVDNGLRSHGCLPAPRTSAVLRPQLAPRVAAPGRHQPSFGGSLDDDDDDDAFVFAASCHS